MIHNWGEYFGATLTADIRIDAGGASITLGLDENEESITLNLPDGTVGDTVLDQLEAAVAKAKRIRRGESGRSAGDADA